MDKVAQYQQYVQTLLTQYAQEDVSNEEVEVQLILDTNRDHYQWMNVGWQQFNRIYRCIVHLDIKRWENLAAAKSDGSESSGGFGYNGCSPT